MKPLKVQNIDIGAEFANKLVPRLRSNGDKSGQQFREDLLEPAFLENDRVVIQLDGVDFYTTLWAEEAIGGLVKSYGAAEVERKLMFVGVKRSSLVPKFASFIK